MESYTLNTPEELSLQLAKKVRQRRLAIGWKQQTLAERSGVSLPSLRRFEKTGLISLKSLLNLTFALGQLDDFSKLFQTPAASSIKDLDKQEKLPQRGRK